MSPAERRELRGVLGAAAARVRRGIGVDVAAKQGLRCPKGAPGVRVRDLTHRGSEPVYRTLCPGDIGYREAKAAGPIEVFVEQRGQTVSMARGCSVSRELGYTGERRHPIICYRPGAPGYAPGLKGLGASATDLRSMPLPGSLERYLATGAPMGTVRRDLGAMTAQVPRFVYGLGAALAIFLASRAYKRWRDEKPERRDV